MEPIMEAIMEANVNNTYELETFFLSLPLKDYLAFALSYVGLIMYSNLTRNAKYWTELLRQIV